MKLNIYVWLLYGSFGFLDTFLYLSKCSAIFVGDTFVKCSHFYANAFHNLHEPGIVFR